jgi:hypothetical protein
MRIREGWWPVLSFVAVGCLAFVACGGGSNGGGATPTPVAVLTATPAPTPSPSPIPGTSCGLPPVGNINPSCKRLGKSDLLPQVELAISQAQAAHPEAFSGDQIKDIATYRHSVTQNLEKMGYCVMWDADEVGVKFSNDSSEHFHIDVSSGVIQRGWGVYRLTCSPAAFPASDAPLPQRANCSLPTSVADGCGPTDTPLFADVMDQVYADIQKDRPDLVGADGKVLVYDPADHTGDNRPIYKAYIAEISARLQAKGYCTSIDETIINLKNSNDYSEWYTPVHEGPPFPERRNDFDPKTGYTQSAHVGYDGICRPAGI